MKAGSRVPAKPDSPEHPEYHHFLDFLTLLQASLLIIVVLETRGKPGFLGYSCLSGKKADLDTSSPPLKVKKVVIPRDSVTFLSFRAIPSLFVTF